MPRLLALLLATASCSLAAAPQAAQPPPPPPPKRLVVRPWMAPPYLLLGLPRDILDAPTKLISSIPLFNKIFFVPLGLLNTLTTALSWSFTEEGVVGGYEAWVHCMGVRRAKGKPLPAAFRGRPWHYDYGPNWRTFGIVYWKPRPAPPKPPEAPAPKPPDARPPKSPDASPPATPAPRP